MDWPTIIELAGKLGADVFIVAAFLFYLFKRDKALSEISTKCHEVSDRSTDAVVENAKMLGKVEGSNAALRVTLGKVEIALLRMNGRTH